MRVVVLGSPSFGIPSLEMLISRGYEVVGIVTQPDRPVGRGKKISPCPLCQRALDMGLPVYTFSNIRAPEAVEQLENLAPDLMITVAYGQILTRKILSIPPLGVINVHGSLLPKYRGPAPIQWAILNGERETGITTMLTERGVDSGPMLLKAAVMIGENETAGELFDRMAVLGAKVLSDTLDALEAGTLAPIPQNQEEATYCAMLTREDGILDWKNSADALHNRVRGMSPWPGTSTYMGRAQVKILETRPEADSIREAPGTVVSAGREGIRIAAGEGILRILRLQLPGKKPLDADAFLRGKKVAPGDVWG